MYQRSPMTERVQAIREKCRSTKPAIDISRYRLVTEFYTHRRLARRKVPLQRPVSGSILDLVHGRTPYQQFPYPRCGPLRAG